MSEFRDIRSLADKLEDLEDAADDLHRTARRMRRYDCCTSMLSYRELQALALLVSEPGVPFCALNVMNYMRDQIDAEEKDGQ